LTVVSAPLESSPTPEPGTPALGRHTARGFVWMLGQNLLTKGIGFIGQIVTAWFLDKNDWGLISLTLAVSCFPNLIRDAGLQTILVQRQKHMRRWVGPVFWMSLTLGLVSALVMAVLAPIAAHVYQDKRLINLIGIIAISSIFSSFGTVPTAIAQIQLRFRLQAFLGAFNSILMQCLCMLLAWKGFGPYSYIIPNAVCNGVNSAAFWIVAPVRITMRMHLRRWRLLMPSSGALIADGIVGMAVIQGVYLVIGWFHPKDGQVGVYSFAANLSWQTLILLTINLGQVLFPALAKLNSDPKRQVQAYLRSVRVLALVAVPACLLQAALAEPGFHLVFRSKWYPSIPVMQMLSLGMAIRCVGITWLTMTVAQGRYTFQLKLNSLFCIVNLTAVALAARFGGAMSVAVVSTVYFMVADPIALYAMLHTSGVRALPEIRRIFTAPIIAGLTSVGIGWALARALPPFRGDNLVRIFLITLVSVAIYVMIIRTFAPADWKELLSLRRTKRVASGT
jgi:O-antigen/teichoic acid export membrane protein